LLGITAKRKRVCLVLVLVLLGLGAATDPWIDCDRDRQNEQCYDQVISENQSSVAVAYAGWRKSTILYGKGDLEGAIKAIDEAAKIDPQYAPFRSWLTPNEKTKAFARENLPAYNATKADRNNTTALLYDAVDLYDRGMYDESIQRYNEAIELDPENITARFGMVLDFIENRQLSNITKTLDEIAELGFDDTVVWEDVAISLWQEHQLYEEAIRCFNRSIAIHNEFIKLNSSNASAWNNKGVCLGLQANVDRDGYLYLTLNDDEALFSKSQAHARYREDKWNEALECFEKATQLDPMCADAWYNKGMALYALNDGSESIEYYEETVHCFDQAQGLQPRKECSRLIDTRYAEVAMRDKLMEMKMTPRDVERASQYT
jgi:tetratricopeptide (TPR) repeat protein